MPDFPTDREALTQARQRVAEAERTNAAARARAERAAEERLQFARRAQPNDAGDARRLRALDTALDEARRAATSAEEGAKRATEDVVGLLGSFAERFDPRTLVSQLDDRTPLLLLPLRLETRFKRTGRTAELWVRVFPDDCLVEPLGVKADGRTSL